MIAALYVQKNGRYYNLDGVDPWDEERDARQYAGPHRVVAHPPCDRWGAYSEGGPSHPGTKVTGADGGCFFAALQSVRKWGGIIEHPANSKAWAAFGLRAPPRKGGWVKADEHGGWTCCVEQGHYGHVSRKATWLYTTHPNPPELKWGSSQAPDRGGCPWADSDVRTFQKPPKGAGPEWRAERRKWLLWRKEQGYKIYCSPELMSKSQRARTPVEFRDLLISIARQLP